MPARSRRRSTLLVAAVAAFAGVAIAGCADQSAAVRVGDTTVSQSDFETELDAFADLQGRDSVTGDLSGSYTQEFVAAVLGQRVELILATQVFDEQGRELTDREVRDLTDQARGQLDGMPEGLRRSLIEDLARRTQLLDDLGQQEYSRVLTEAADATDIEVSSHYGTWDAEQYRVVPPEGPAPAPNGGSSSETTAGG